VTENDFEVKTLCYESQCKNNFVVTDHCMVQGLS
jgi:hypothetical protein